MGWQILTRLNARLGESLADFQVSAALLNGLTASMSRAADVLRSDPRSGQRNRRVAVVAFTTLAVLGLSGCSLPSGRTDQTLEEGAVQTQQEVISLISNVPAEWLQSSADDVPVNDYSYCGSVMDAGPNGSARWSYGLGFDLVRPMSNAELLTLLAPSGDEWVLRPRTSSGDADDTSINDRVYDSSDMIVTLYLGGESSKRPRIGVTATTKCIRIGETGPGTFPTPIPTSIPKPAPKP